MRMVQWMSISDPRLRLIRKTTGETIPGKGWNTLLRLYSPLEPWFNKTWRPGDIEPM